MLWNRAGLCADHHVTGAVHRARPAVHSEPQRVQDVRVRGHLLRGRLWDHDRRRDHRGSAPELREAERRMLRRAFLGGHVGCTRRAAAHTALRPPSGRQNREHGRLGASGVERGDLGARARGGSGDAAPLLPAQQRLQRIPRTHRLACGADSRQLAPPAVSPAPAPPRPPRPRPRPLARPRPDIKATRPRRPKPEPRAGRRVRGSERAAASAGAVCGAGDAAGAGCVRGGVRGGGGDQGGERAGEGALRGHPQRPPPR
mmetsp:Transcript_32310/g.77135  ORF Transcript_32310/g.77135 Transcript_32310/m.77135 type:complete len:258 (+) Transcript_32310:343-1116(+)